MATDRMWLVHKPTGKKCLLAKTWELNIWHEYTGHRDSPDMQGLFNECGYDSEYIIKYELKDGI